MVILAFYVVLPPSVEARKVKAAVVAEPVKVGILLVLLKCMKVWK